MNKIIKRIAPLFFVTLIAISLKSFSSTPSQILTPESLFQLHSVVEVSISPNSGYVAYTVNVPRPIDHRPGADYRELHLVNLANNQVDKLIVGEGTLFSIGWTIAGDAITFRANRPEAPGVQLYKFNIAQKRIELLFKHDLSISQYQLIEDSVLLFTALEPDITELKELKEKGFSIDVFEEEWKHLNLYTHDFSKNHTQQLTKGITVFDFIASPNGKKVAAAISPKNLVDYSYMFQRIHLIDIETGDISLLIENPGKLGNMEWSPDGTKLAFRSASKLEDSVVGSLFVVDVPNNRKFSELTNYAQGLEMSIIDVKWKDNSTLLYAAEEGVDVVLSEQKLNAKTRNILPNQGNVVLRRFQFANGIIAFSGNTAKHPAEVFVYKFKDKECRRITRNNEWLGGVNLAKQEKLEYTARDGKRIEGILMYPVNYHEGKKYPLITYIHGGPESAVQNGWTTRYSTWGQVAAARNYFVFMPNYRASSGRGVDFTMVGYADLVGVEYDDVLDGIDHLIEIGFVDKAKVGIGGGSYGGYFAAWSATKHTDRFAASVVFVGISNQVSKRKTTDIPWEDYHVHWGFWTHENNKKVWDASPIQYAHQSKTPTLILHGTHDSRIHPSQGLELYRALKLHSKAPVRLVWYNNEGHGNRINLNQYDYLIRTLEWFDYYLKSDSPKEMMPNKYPKYQL